MQQGSTNQARHRKRPLLSTTESERRNPILSDEDDRLRRINTSPRVNDDGEERARLPRPWSIRLLFRMTTQLRLRQWKVPRRRRVLSRLLAIFVVALVFVVTVQRSPLHVFLWGDGYHVEGGIFGRWLDQIVAELYHERYSSHSHYDDGHDGAVVEYPHVKLRSNRKEVPGYSRYLDEILTRDRNKNLVSADWSATFRGDSSGMYDSRVFQEWTVDIQEQEINENKSSSKSTSHVLLLRSVADRLRRSGCQPGWICHRCLAVPWWGSLDQCTSSWACPPCFSTLLCSSSSDDNDMSSSSAAGGENPFISIQAHVTGNSVCDGSRPRQGRSTIPRIVHVVGGPSSSPLLDLLQYPELVRIQNGWRAAGYSYRYYTAKSARALVQRQYPSRFLHVYDALLQSSLFDQLHFFRLLVLFQQGGIVANADLMLEVNPDALFGATATANKDREQQQQQVSFVATIDADMDECLWDGFVAARPGHPLVARAIELFYNRLVVTQRLDDQLEWMKSGACRHADDTTVLAGSAAAAAAVAAAKTIPLWKVRRQHQALLYHGNAKRRGLMFCTLGEAVHKAQSRSFSWMNTPFQPGFYTMKSHHCAPTTTSDSVVCKDESMLLLMMSRDDTGATRLTDVDHNLLVASTDVMGVSMESISARINKVIRKNQDGGVTSSRLTDFIASNKKLDPGGPIQIHILSKEEISYLGDMTSYKKQ